MVRTAGEGEKKTGIPTSAGPSDRLLLLTKTGVSGAAGTKLRPSFGPVVEVPIDKGFSLTCRFASYIDDVL